MKRSGILAVVLILLGLTFAETVGMVPQQQLKQLNSSVVKAYEAFSTNFPDQPLWQQAIQKASKLTEEYPQDPQTWRMLAHIYTITHWWYRAEQAWKAYLKLAKGRATSATNKDIETVQIQMGYAAYRLGNIQSAIKHFTDASLNNPKDPTPSEWLGRIYLEKDKPKIALSYWQQAHSIKPTPINTYFMQQAKAMMAHGPQAVRLFTRGYFAFQVGDLTRALHSFQKVVVLDPDWLEPLRWVGRIQLKLNQSQTALLAWQMVVNSPKSTTGDRYFLQLARIGVKNGLPAAHAYLDGISSFQDGNYTKARIDFATAAKLNPSFALAWYWLGRMAFDQQDYATAAKAYGTVLKLEPRNKGATYFLRLAKQAEVGNSTSSTTNHPTPKNP